MRRHDHLSRFAVAVIALFAGWVAVGLLTGESETEPLKAPLPVHMVSSDFDILPITPADHLDVRKVALGRQLFLDPRLSVDNTIACVSCHDLKNGGADHRSVSIGVKGARGNINAPTVFNSSLNVAQFWDGRAATLEEQAAGPVHNPLEMANDWTTIISRLQSDSAFRSAFVTAYPEGITVANLQNAIATFERSLLTPNSRFDRYLRGESALNQDEIKGLQRFRELGCTACHQGVLLGGNMFQKFGVLRDYFAGRPSTPADMGRKNVTGRDEDLHVFKVPSLRNVARTSPYFHDGSVTSLEEAILIMGRHQLGLELSPRDVQQIAAFLRSLTGEWEGVSTL